MTSTNQTALDVVLAYQEAWTSGDLETAAGCLAGDVVWIGPTARLDGPGDFMRGLGRFADTLAPGWRKIAAMADGDGVLLMFEVDTASGTPIRAADYFTVSRGRIQTDTMVFDTLAYRTAVTART